MSSSIGEQFAQLIAAGRISFRPVSPTDLEPWGRVVVQTYLRGQAISFQLGDVTIDGVYCLKLDDSYLQYLDIYPDAREFEWWTSEHTQDLWPNDASVHLIKLLGVKATVQELAPGLEQWRLTPDEERN